MKAALIFLIVVALVNNGFVVGENSSHTTVVTSVASSTQSSTVPPSNSSTMPTKPTTAPTPPTTAQPTTPTPTTAPPTTPPTTAPPTTPPTTAPPTTPTPTTAPPTTPTPAPVTTTSKPAPTEDTWAVTNKTSNEICILMKSNVILNVNYIVNATSKKTDTTKIELPAYVKVNGTCGNNNSSQTLVVEWNQFNSTVNNKTSQIVFTFNKGSDNKCEYFISNVTANVFVNASENNATVIKPINLLFSGKEFIAHDGVSYTCSNPSALKLKAADNSTAELHLNSLQYEAYHKTADKKFSSAQDCEPAQTPDIVPILVAGALILLVILVLAAYVITRRRSQSRGYLSM